MALGQIEQKYIISIPVDSAIDQLFCNGHTIVLSIHTSEEGYSTNGFTEKAVRYGENIRLMNDGEVLGNQLAASTLSAYGRQTLRGRARANSKAICPIRRDALSVISRVARASFPCSPTVRVSSLTY